MRKRINICIDQRVYSKLKEKGKFGESFSDLISRIIEETNQIPKKNSALEVSNENA